MQQHAQPAPLAPAAGRPALYEVWGDTIDAGHLAWAVALGAAISLGTYFSARWSLARLLSDPQMVPAYAMLAGILGCLIGGVVSAAFFKPKRTVVEEVVDEKLRSAVVADLVAQYGDIGRIEDLSPEVAAELRELGLYELFEQIQHAHAQPPGREGRSAQQRPGPFTPALGETGA
ncbi:hypothetical protein [Xylophilus sp.]|uniref:hypothetical protein n=1 Tax=Xylophilus sp. TaxID=2653893 RepID=UPI0013BADBD6|nr:hypothetical protein [Xylophilus sp.]KAF1045540.1 MAG: hypothetical protein GAK38_02989 [Xylophilus sp.]